MQTIGYRAVPPVEVVSTPLPLEIDQEWSISTVVGRCRAVMVDFDRHRSISGGISRGRKKKREKRRENLEIRCCSPDLGLSPAGFSALR
ncbi:hypothetical protein BHE74_00046365 [Ensete ventricosum]|nr:hypothetical protein BHE74_00046365 [Ensete ventricosum]RZS19384.1 hypothetical protein BHM03_00051769 [Ensete ventricosum]